MKRMREADLADVPVVVGGIIPSQDAETLRASGVARVYTPKDFDLNTIIADILDIVETATPAAA
jgi:(2R)-ethylmalonyl-CoA mutase